MNSSSFKINYMLNILMMKLAMLLPREGKNINTHTHESYSDFRKPQSVNHPSPPHISRYHYDSSHMWQQRAIHLTEGRKQRKRQEVARKKKPLRTHAECFLPKPRHRWNHDYCHDFPVLMTKISVKP